jgi:hypothetical protein
MPQPFILLSQNLRSITTLDIDLREGRQRSGIREEKTGTSTHRIGDESTPDMNGHNGRGTASGGLKHRGGSEH